MKVSVVTVNFKTKEYLARMLETLFRFSTGCEVEVFVVENASGDDLSDLQARFPQVRFLFSKTNLGFAGGCNLAIREATGDVIALVNPDIVFTQDALCEITERLEHDRHVGVAGISLKNLDGSQQACVWRFPRPFDQILLLLKAPHFLKRVPPVERWKMADFDYAKTQDVDQVMGAFFCFRRELVDRIGLLDDGFFMWYEEVDFCKRAKDAGWIVRYYADVSVQHKRGSSFENLGTLQKQAMVRRSLRRFMRKHYGVGAWLAFVILDPLFIVAAYVSAMIKPK
jgi:hypothetical protein